MGLAMKIDTSFRQQVEAILIEYGLIENEPQGSHFIYRASRAINNSSEMTREEAMGILFEELEKGEKSGICPLSEEEFWAQFSSRGTNDENSAE